MGTRCVIRLMQFGRSVDLYHHWDGYPEGVGLKLRDEIRHWFEGRPADLEMDAGELATYLVKNAKDGKDGSRYPATKNDDDGFVVTVFQHWDAEYLYELDFGMKSGLTKDEMLQRLKCYKLKMHLGGDYAGYDKQDDINLAEVEEERS